ncbi:RNA polymerase II subunit A [Corchorus olitorius]|uniref:RNA polymerase II subunit A C-terminal domain phosphatase SSU72 n=1 Tax=Corchorus olitorius TaxID=93759 RepID=A0A1R3GNA8_9ROSI|nr:RNA polymerase II subunit A [Corchorus olitorius]
MNMFEDLRRKDPELYKRNEILPMLKRNLGVKLTPQRWQDNALLMAYFNIVFTFEELVVLLEYIVLEGDSLSALFPNAQLSLGLVMSVIGYLLTLLVTLILPPAFYPSILRGKVSRIQWPNGRQATVFKGRAQLNHLTHKTQCLKLSCPSKIFMYDTSISFVKLVDSRDITELQLKQSDGQLLIRKKETLLPLETNGISHCHGVLLSLCSS